MPFSLCKSGGKHKRWGKKWDNEDFRTFVESLWQGVVLFFSREVTGQAGGRAALLCLRSPRAQGPQISMKELFWIYKKNIYLCMYITIKLHLQFPILRLTSHLSYWLRFLINLEKFWCLYFRHYMFKRQASTNDKWDMPLSLFPSKFEQKAHSN